MYNDITLEKIGAAAVITFRRPDTLNAFTYPMLDEIQVALQEAEADPDVVAIILTGEGRGFSSGMDMGALQETSSGTGVRRDPDAPRPGDKSMGDNFLEGFTFMMTMRKPIIGAINGAAAGIGLSLALFCDMRFASATAKFVTSFSQRGLVAEHGQSWILPRVVGPSRALDLFMSSRKLMADEAKEMGLVDRVYPPEDLMEQTLAYVEQLAATTAPASLMVMKQQVYGHLNMSLGEAMRDTDRLMKESLVHDDFKEGIASFVEKRAPKFSKIKVEE